MISIQDKIITDGVKNNLTRDVILEKLKLQRDTAILSLQHEDDVFSRNTFKRSTMTVSTYDAKYISVRQSTIDALETTQFLSQATKDEISRLSVDIYHQITMSMDFSKAYKDYAKGLIKHALETEDLVSYSAPLTGFPVRLKVNEVERRKIKYITPSSKRQAKTCLQEITGRTDRRKTTSSSVPSIIHSIDSAVLLETAEVFALPIATIHDCLGTLPTLIPKLRSSTNIVMSKLYLADALQLLADQLDYDVPPPSFELDDNFVVDILQSEYAFN